MHFAALLRCFDHSLPLNRTVEPKVPGGEMAYLECSEGCRFPIVGDIPRFVDSQSYASAFGTQWNAFRTVQLDSFTGLTISRDRLTRLAGGSLDIFQGKDVLEAGCGAGRFTEILLASGANVFAVDLSEAV